MDVCRNDVSNTGRKVTDALARVSRREDHRKKRPAQLHERFFGSIAETHSQPGNIERVARSKPTRCVDSVTYAFFCRHQLGALTRVLAATPPSPSIPFVSSIETPAPLQDTLRQALRHVARSNEWAETRAGLMLQDIVPVELASYGVQLQYEREAHASGYSELK
jgi:hypothetical protein